MVNISQTELDLLMALYTACREVQQLGVYDLPEAVDDATIACRDYIDGPDDCTPRGGPVEESPAYRASLKSAGRGYLLK